MHLFFQHAIERMLRLVSALTTVRLPSLCRHASPFCKQLVPAYQPVSDPILGNRTISTIPNRVGSCRILLLLLTAATLVGCSKEQQAKIAEATKSVTEKAQDAVGDATDKAKEVASDVGAKAQAAAKSAQQATSDAIKNAPSIAQGVAEGVMPTPGEATISVDETMSFSGAFIRLIKLSDRPNVVQVRSYDMPEDESFPAFLFQGTSTVEDVASLSGSTIQGKMFLQAAEDGPVWSCLGGEVVTVTIAGTNAEGELEARIADGNLTASTGERLQVRGEIKAHRPQAATSPTSQIQNQSRAEGIARR